MSELHIPQVRPLPWVFDDGGRSLATGFGGTSRVSDCVVRAIAIAGLFGYAEVYQEIFERQKHWASTARSQAARQFRERKSISPVDIGVANAVWRSYIQELGWTWVPTMAIGTGTKVHLAQGELPDGRLVARCSRHLVAVVDGVIHDTHDPSRRGTRAVYGYYVAA
jgi:hypothetical protein